VDNIVKYKNISGNYDKQAREKAFRNTTIKSNKPIISKETLRVIAESAKIYLRKIEQEQVYTDYLVRNDKRNIKSLSKKK